MRPHSCEHYLEGMIQLFNLRVFKSFFSPFRLSMYRPYMMPEEVSRFCIRCDRYHQGSRCFEMTLWFMISDYLFLCWISSFSICPCPTRQRLIFFSTNTIQYDKQLSTTINSRILMRNPTSQHLNLHVHHRFPLSTEPTVVSLMLCPDCSKIASCCWEQMSTMKWQMFW